MSYELELCSFDEPACIGELYLVSRRSLLRGAGQIIPANLASISRESHVKWLRNGKFGIYTQWGVYAVPAMGPNATWYSHNVYMRPDSQEHAYHEATYGPLEKFGYKDFIPMFTAEEFNADEWAELFQKAGAPLRGQSPSITTDSPCGTRSTPSGTRRILGRSAML